MLICRFAWDAEVMDEGRKRHLEEHRKHLRSGSINIVQSGVIYSVVGAQGRIGALIVFDVSTVDEVERFSARDPYVLHGVYREVSIVRWDRTIG